MRVWDGKGGMGSDSIESFQLKAGTTGKGGGLITAVNRNIFNIYVCCMLPHFHLVPLFPSFLVIPGK